MMPRVMTAVLVAVSLLASFAMAADWPQFMGPSRTGIAPDTGLNKAWNTNPPPVVWRVPMSDNGYAGPSVADGKVFIMDRNGDNDVVRALNLANGTEAWRHEYPEPGRDNYGYSRSTPTYADGKLYTFSRYGTFNCYNASNGQVLWSRQLLREIGAKPPKWNFALSVLVDGNRAVVQTGSPAGNVLAVNKDTGQTLWTSQPGGISGYATAVIAEILGKRQYVLATGKEIIGVDPDNGNKLWGFEWITAHDVNASQPIVEGNFVFIASGYNVGCALVEITPQGPQLRWQNKTISPHFSSPIYYNGYIYSNSDNGGGSIVCMSPQAGETAWQQRGFEKGGLLIADGTIIACVGNTGDVVMAQADPGGYQELGRIKPLGGQSWTAPVLSNGMLLVRNKTELACIRLK